jgi:serine/threonine-protein kinase
MSAECASEDVILELVSGQLDLAARTDVERHIASCDECRKLVAALARTSLVGGATPTNDATDANHTNHASDAGDATEREDGARDGVAPRKDIRVRPGDKIAGKYLVERVIGRGGMGIVMLAMHEQLGQRVAIKLLMHEAYGSTDIVKRLLREARATAQLTSEHVTKVMDVGTLDDGAPYMVMEHLRGEDLSGLLKANGALPVERALVYVLQACEGVAEAHARGIVHRDLKPANLFVTSRADGSPLVKVLDFGIAKAWTDDTTTLTSKATLMGSPRYMSPEQMTDARAVDVRTDVWAIGAILYELVSGKPAFDGESVVAVCTKVATMPAPHLRDLDTKSLRVLDATIQKCLEKEPSARFQSIAEVARALAPIAPEEARVSVQRIERMLGVKDGEGATSSSRAPSTMARPVIVIIASLVVVSLGARAWLSTSAAPDVPPAPSVSVVEPLPARESASPPPSPSEQSPSSQPSASAQPAATARPPVASTTSTARAPVLPPTTSATSSSMMAPTTPVAPNATAEPADAGAVRFMDRKGFTDRN